MKSYTGKSIWIPLAPTTKTITNPYPQQYAEFQKITSEMYELHVKKNNDYGPGNIGELGLKGVFVRIWDKTSRLKSLVWQGNVAQVVTETIQDTLMDLAMYCIIGLIYLRGKWGK